MDVAPGTCAIPVLKAQVNGRVQQGGVAQKAFS
jgi:hypothetical protein